MADDEKLTLRDYWATFSDKMSDATRTADEKLIVAKEKTASAAKKAAEKTSEVAKKTAEKTSQAAKQAAEKGSELSSKVKDAVHERRTRPNEKLADLEPMHGVIPPKPILPPLERMAEREGKVVIPVEDYDEMCAAVSQLQESEARSAELIDKIVSLESLNHELHVEKREGKWSLVSRKGEVRALDRGGEGEPPQKLTQELARSLGETTTILGVSVLWLAGLTGLDYAIESGLLALPVLPVATDLAVWSIGTGAWALFVLWRLKKVRSLLSMPLGMRIQTSIGVGLVTAMTLILMQEQQAALQNVWGWTATVALAAVLLSGFVRGIWGSMKRFGTIGRPKTEIVDVEAIPPK